MSSDGPTAPSQDRLPSRGQEDSSERGPAALRKAYLDAEPVLHVSEQGTVLEAFGEVSGWFGGETPVGGHFSHLFEPGSRADVETAVGARMIAVDELRPRLLDGRRAALTAWPCGAGWLVSLHDVTNPQLLGEAQAHQERMRALADLATAVARELNDPMAIVQGRLELLLALSEGEADPARRHLTVALDHARRISATLRNLRVVGQTRERRLDRVPIANLLDDVLSLLGPRGERVLADISPPDLCAGGEAALLARVVAHTLRQTVEGSARGDVSLRARREGKNVVLRIDVGRRGRAESLDGADFTIDETLLRSVGGRLETFRVSGTPAFVITLRLPPALRARARTRQEDMLLVGAEGFTDSVRRLLDKDGFRFDVATDAGEALDLAASGSHAAVVSELLLPGGMSGLSLGRVLGRAHPLLEGRVIVVTDGPVGPLPRPLLSVCRPLSRAGLLDALGRRVRHG